MSDYTKMTDDDFDEILEDLVSKMSTAEILEDLVSKMSTAEILAYGDVNLLLREHLNNEILDRWEEEQSNENEDSE